MLTSLPFWNISGSLWWAGDASVPRWQSRFKRERVAKWIASTIIHQSDAWKETLQWRFNLSCEKDFKSSIHTIANDRIKDGGWKESWELLIKRKYFSFESSSWISNRQAACKRWRERERKGRRDEWRKKAFNPFLHKAASAEFKWVLLFFHVEASNLIEKLYTEMEERGSRLCVFLEIELSDERLNVELREIKNLSRVLSSIKFMTKRWAFVFRLSNCFSLFFSARSEQDELLSFCSCLLGNKLSERK